MSLANDNGDQGTERARYRGELPKFKVYEEMLMKEILGTPRHNEPLHAVVVNQLAEEEMDEPNNSILERNRALLQYVATIAHSNNRNDEFNYEFIEALVKGGANINVADQYEQTIFHEVARSWNTDVAKFLLDIGCDINKKDSYGRTPLHVAAAVDFADMTKFLLMNNADIDARTFVERQAPIHHAAKNGAVRSLKVLLGFQADINSKDGKQRTALQVAAEWSRAETAKLLLDEGATACLLDSSGNSALCVLIEQLPHLALEGLDQLYANDIITMKDFYYLQYLENKQPGSKIRTPLEVAVATQKYEVIMHPVIQRLIHNKWKQFGKFSTMFDIAFRVLYGVLWTAACTGLPPTGKEIWHKPRIRQNILLFFIVIFTTYDMATQISKTVKSRRSQRDWVAWRLSQLEHDMEYCHPRWLQEQQYVKHEMKRVKALPLLTITDAWFYIEWLILIVHVATAILYIIYAVEDTAASRYIFPRMLSILNLLVWLRLLRYVRPVPGIGTLVIILAETTTDFVNWAFLYFLLLLPFTAAFWINFGGMSPNPVIDYDDVQGLLYSVFRIAVGDQYNFEGLDKADPVMSRILVVLYVTAVAIVTLNLLIALLADTFSRVYNNAVANTVMQRAMKVVDAGQRLTRKAREKYDEYMRINCAPEIIKVICTEDKLTRSQKIMGNEINKQLRFINEILKDCFGKSYGKTQITDFDLIFQHIKKIKAQQEELANDLVEISKMIKLYADNYDRIKRRELMEQMQEPERSSKSFLSTLQEIASSLTQTLSTILATKKEKRGTRKVRRSRDHIVGESSKRSKKRRRERRNRRKEKLEEKPSSRKRENDKRRVRNSQHTTETATNADELDTVPVGSDSWYNVDIDA